MPVVILVNDAAGLSANPRDDIARQASCDQVTHIAFLLQSRIGVRLRYTAFRMRAISTGGISLNLALHPSGCLPNG
jgi:hypothetical protein